MRLSTWIIGFVLVVSLATPSITLAQAAATSIGEWSVVMAVPADEKLEIELKNGQTIKGKVSSVSDTRLTLAHKKKTILVDRENAHKIHLVTGRSRAKSALIGAGAGAGTGAGLFAGLSVGSGSAKLVALLSVSGAFIFGTVGTLVGYVVGKGKKRVLIYQAK